MATLGGFDLVCVSGIRINIFQLILLLFVNYRSRAVFDDW
jgi:hypothetical protein